MLLDGTWAVLHLSLRYRAILGIHRGLSVLTFSVVGRKGAEDDIERLRGEVGREEPEEVPGRYQVSKSAFFFFFILGN
jgi:hypothetical protein